MNEEVKKPDYNAMKKYMREMYPDKDIDGMNTEELMLLWIHTTCDIIEDLERVARRDTGYPELHAVDEEYRETIDMMDMVVGQKNIWNSF